MRSLAKIFFFLLKIVGILLAFALLLSILACYVSPAKYWFVQFFGLFFPIIFVSNIVAAVVLLMMKSKTAYINLLILIISFFYTGRFFQFSGNKANDGETIKILTYNVHGFQNINNGNNTYNEIGDFLIAEDADIICLQEYFVKSKGFKTSVMAKKMLKIYKYTCGDYDEKILSKYPFEGRQNLNIGGKRIIFSDININGKIVRIYSCHLQSTNFNPDGTQKRLLSNKGNYKRELKHVVVNLRNAFKKRAKQVELIAKSITESPYPAIVCGDFNDTPMSYSYQKIRGKLNDTFIEAGGGIPNTYKKLFSILRIDYIFTDKNINTAEYRVAKEVKYSDHYPVVVKLNINNEK
jgi:endonuclease/exonuclease/phosphatase family metal-dependent hydrolase